MSESRDLLTKHLNGPLPGRFIGHILQIQDHLRDWVYFKHLDLWIASERNVKSSELDFEKQGGAMWSQIASPALRSRTMQEHQTMNHGLTTMLDFFTASELPVQIIALGRAQLPLHKLVRTVRAGQGPSII
jgi:hypothetical protein